MTEYITIPVTKRNFTVLAQMPEVSDTAVTLINPDDTYIARNGDTYIARNGDTYIAHNISTGAYPRLMKAEKRNFTVVAKVRGTT